MERDPRGGEAKKASPGHIPSESEIDDLLWATYAINPRRQMVVPVDKPLTNDDQKSMSKESHVDPELTVRKCPKCTNQIKPGSYTEHVAKCDGKYSDFGGRFPKPNAGDATG